jgi:hypothetical protein
VASKVVKRRLEEKEKEENFSSALTPLLRYWWFQKAVK